MKKDEIKNKILKMLKDKEEKKEANEELKSFIRFQDWLEHKDISTNQSSQFSE